MEINFRAGDSVRVYQRITEGQAKTRVQVFEGVVIALNRHSRSFTVRKMSDGVGVERIFPFDSPWIEKIVVKKRTSSVRRAKLYYSRGLTPKEMVSVTG